MKKSLSSRIAAHGMSLVSNASKDVKYSYALARDRFCADVCGQVLHNNQRALKYRRKVHKTVEEHLTRTLQKVIALNMAYYDDASYSNAAPIWICWFQGRESAPNLVNSCIESIRLNCGNHEVRIVNFDNLGDYLCIPEYISSKVEQGKIGLANYADYIRSRLLYEYGGLWIDAEVFCSGSIPEEYFTHKVFSLKYGRGDDTYIAAGRWISGVIGGWKGAKLFKFLSESFEAYFQQFETPIDYFMIDYLIDIASREYPDIAEELDAIPINNTDRYLLRDAMMRDEPAGSIVKALSDSTVFYILSRKSPYGMESKDGQPTIFAAYFS